MLQYQKDFEFFSSLGKAEQPGLTEDYFVKCFIGGPKEEIGGFMDLSKAYKRDQISVWACLFLVNLDTPKEQLSNPITQLLSEFEDVFQEPKSLPPQRLHDHHIPFQTSSDPFTIRPYRYP